MLLTVYWNTPIRWLVEQCGLWIARQSLARNPCCTIKETHTAFLIVHKFSNNQSQVAANTFSRTSTPTLSMKRIPRILITLLLGSILGLIALGLFVQEVTYTSTVTVSAPPEVVWTTYGDAQRLSEWLGGYERMTLLSSQPGTVGSRQRLHFENGSSVTVTVTEVVPYTKYGFEIKTEKLIGRVTAVLEGIDAGTRVTQTVHARGISFYSRAILPVIKPVLSLRQMAVLDELEYLIERKPAAVPPE